MSVPPDYSNYPRPQYATYGSGMYQRPPGIYFDAIGEAWTLFTRQWSTWVAAALLVVAISAPVWFFSGLVTTDVVNLVVGPPTSAYPSIPWFILTMLLGLIPGAVYQTLTIGLFLMGVRQIQGAPISVGDVFRGFPSIHLIFVGSVLYSLISWLGCALCIIPGIYAISVMVFYGIIIVDQGVGPMEGLARSFQALKPLNLAVGMFALLLVIGLLVGVSAFACGVGLLAGIPIYALTIALHYTYFFPPAMSPGFNRIDAAPPV